MTLEKILQKYTRSYMSNAKWRKLFSVVHERNLAFSHCVWKLVTESEPTPGHVPDIDELGDTYVGDCGALNGPFEFREIEWILIPRSHAFRRYENAPLEHKTQQFDSIVSQIESLGQFEYELTDEGLKVYGYRP